MSSEVRRVKARCTEAKLAAWRDGALELRPHLSVPIKVNGWTRSAVDAYRAQWHGAGKGLGWDWEEIFRRFRDLDMLDVTVWTEADLLCGIGVATLSNSAVVLRFLEARLPEDNPLKGEIALIIMDVAARYGQRMGRSEMRCYPLNQKVADYYRYNLGFNLVTPHKEEPYYVREL
jgi:hypothetical protein